MTAIWQNNGSGWHLLVPTGFPNEATLHKLVEEAPHLLPLGSTPRLVVVGREVQLGSGYADLIAIEPGGRLAIIEIKLARNAEVRRAVIAQVLAYGAYLWGIDQRTLEQDILYKHLHGREYESLAHAVESNDQEGSFDAEAFAAGLGESLKLGRFRYESAIAELVSFAKGLERDEAAVRTSLSLPWSQGPVEGAINKLKLIKRSMYGRANFDLLRTRVLYAVS